MAYVSEFWLRFATGVDVPSSPPIEADDPLERISMTVWEGLPERERLRIMRSYLPDPDRVFHANYLVTKKIRTKRKKCDEAV